jgi:peroxiredoxin
LLRDSFRETTQLLAVSIDDHETSQKLIQRLEDNDSIKVDFPLLADPGHKVINRYGLLNPQGNGWPHPATYVIDKQGIVRWKFVEVDYKVRPANAAILEALQAVQ